MSIHNGSTISQAATASPTTQQVTGQTAFWAILPLALNAMGQQSTTASAFFTSSSSTLEPHLSSPAVAAVDCILDLITAFRTLFYPAPGDTLTAPISAASTTMPIERMTVRLLLFLFGVLPQAIRIFGMRGIPITQALAAIFMSTSVARMLCISATRWTGRKNDDFVTWLTSTKKRKTITRRSILLLHTGICFFAWFQIGQVPHLNRTDRNISVKNVCDWAYYAAFTPALATSLYWIIRMFFSPLTRSPMRRKKFVLIPISPFVVLTLIWPWLEYPGYLLRAGDARLRCEQDQTQAFEKCMRDRTWMWDVYPFNTFNSLMMDPLKPFIVSMLPLCAPALLGSWTLAFLVVGGSRWLSGKHDDNARVTVAENSDPSSQDAGSVNTALQVDTRDASENPGRKNIFDEDEAATHAMATVAYVLLDVKKWRKYQMSESYRKWVLVSHSFYNFRRTLPQAFVEAWKGGSSGSSATSDSGNSVESGVVELGSPMPADSTDTSAPEAGEVQISEEYVELPRAKRLFWAFLIYGGMGFVQLFLFLFFASQCLIDFEPVYRGAKKLMKLMRSEEHWIAFAIFNLATTASYYFLAYDGHGTVNPSWTNLLNR